MHSETGLTVALTGGTGFVGRHLLDALLDAGHRVRALTRRAQPERARVDWIGGDLTQPATLERLVVDADAIVHAAGVVKATGRTGFDAVNVAGLARVLDAAHRSACAGCRFVLVSSLAAREPHLSHYSASKHEAERLLSAEAGALAWTIMRPPAVYGPGDTEILKLFRAVRLGVIPVPGARSNRFSLIHARDLAAALTTVVGHPRLAGRTLELDDGQPDGYRLDDIVGHVTAVLGRQARAITVPKGPLEAVGAINGALARLVGRPAMLTRGKARELGHADWVAGGDLLNDLDVWRPRIAVRQGLEETLGWYRQNGLI